MIYRIVAAFTLAFGVWALPAIASVRPPGSVVLYLRYCSNAKPRRMMVEIYRHGIAGNETDSISKSAVTLLSNGGLHALLRLPEGGYQVSVYDGKCAASLSLGVLAGRLRTAAITLKRYDPQASDNGGDVYNPAGDLAGTLPDRGISLILRGRNGQSYSPIVSNSAYYFDDIPAGTYTMRLTGGNFVQRQNVVIPKNSVLLRKDF